MQKAMYTCGWFIREAVTPDSGKHFYECVYETGVTVHMFPAKGMPAVQFGELVLDVPIGHIESRRGGILEIVKGVENCLKHGAVMTLAQILDAIQ